MSATPVASAGPRLPVAGRDPAPSGRPPGVAGLDPPPVGSVPGGPEAPRAADRGSNAASFAAALMAAARRFGHPGPDSMAERLEPGADQPPAASAALMPQPPGLAPAEAAAALPASGQPTIDPAALADLLASLWQRSRERRTSEVRVSFGAAAWPATGARLEGLPDGSIVISVSVDRRHGEPALDLDRLRRRLGERGVAAGPIRLSPV